MLNVYLRNPQTDAGAWLNFPASYQTVQHTLRCIGWWNIIYKEDKSMFVEVRYVV